MALSEFEAKRYKKLVREYVEKHRPPTHLRNLWKWVTGADQYLSVSIRIQTVKITENQVERSNGRETGG
ncbi:MAG: hypothetical protein JJE15_04415 [Desulfobacteraceae bacterium]|nr:hypothetical protein [Desulfobacteraceae bacterium]